MNKLGSLAALRPSRLYITSFEGEWASAGSPGQIPRKVSCGNTASSGEKASKRFERRRHRYSDHISDYVGHQDQDGSTTKFLPEMGVSKNQGPILDPKYKGPSSKDTQKQHPQFTETAKGTTGERLPQQT